MYSLERTTRFVHTFTRSLQTTAARWASKDNAVPHMSQEEEGGRLDAAELSKHGRARAFATADASKDSPQEAEQAADSAVAQALQEDDGGRTDAAELSKKGREETVGNAECR